MGAKSTLSSVRYSYADTLVQVLACLAGSLRDEQPARPAAQWSGTLADDPEPEFARVRARDLQEAVVAQTGPCEVDTPFLPEEIRDKGSVGDNTATRLGRVFQKGPGLGL